MKKTLIISITLFLCITAILDYFIVVNAFFALDPPPKIETDKENYFIDELIKINATWNYYSQTSENLGVKIFFLNETPESLSIDLLFEKSIYIIDCPENNGYHELYTNINLTELSLNQRMLTKQYWLVLTFFLYINDEPSNSVVDKYPTSVNISKYTPSLFNNHQKISLEFNNYRLYENQIIAFENMTKAYDFGELFCELIKNETVSYYSQYELNNSGILVINFFDFNITDIGNYTLVLNIPENEEFIKNQIILDVEIEPCISYINFINNSAEEVDVNNDFIEFDFFVVDSNNSSINLEGIEWELRSNLVFISINIEYNISNIKFENPKKIGNFSFSLWGNSSNYYIINNTFSINFYQQSLNLTLFCKNFTVNESIMFTLQDNMQKNIYQYNSSMFDLQLKIDEEWESLNFSISKFEDNQSKLSFALLWSELKKIDNFANISIYYFRIFFSGTTIVSSSLSNTIEIFRPLFPDFKSNITLSYENEDISFQFTGLTGTGLFFLFWDFGDGTNSTETNPIHSYCEMGNYSISLTITDEEEHQITCEKISYIVVIKNIIPQSNFTIDQDFLFVNQQIQFNFTGSKGNDPTKFFWDFGDGANSTETNPIHIYLFEGFYNVSLTLQDNDGDISVYLITIKIGIDLLPQANFTIIQDFLFVNQQIQFNFTGSKGNDPTKFFWDFGDGANSTETNPIHIYLFEGFYNVSLTLQDNDGDISVYLITIKIGIDLLPQANFTINQDFLFVNQQIQFNFTGSKGNDPTKFFWDFGDGANSTITNPIHIYLFEGFYNVSLAVQDSDEDISVYLITIKIETELFPQANFTINQNFLFVNQQIQFNFTGSKGNDPTKFFWDFGDGANSTITNPIHIYLFEGFYNVSLTLQDNDGDISVYLITIKIGIDLLPQANFTINQDFLFVNQQIQFNFTGSKGNDPTKFFWDFGDGANSTETNPIHIYLFEGFYNVSLTLQDNDGDISVYLITIKIGIDLLPQANFTINQDFLFVNQQIQFNFIGSKGNDPTKFFWDFGDGANSTITNPIHIYLFEGFYNVSLTLQDNDGDISVYLITIIIGIDLLPQANFTIIQDFLFVNQQIQFNFTGSKGNDPTKFFWDFGDGANSTITNPIHIYLFEGFYNVSLTLQDNDGNISSYLITIKIGIDLLPQANFTINQDFLFVNQQIQFNFTGSKGNDPTKFFWDFGDGANSTITNPIHIYLFEGFYNVSLAVQDSDGDISVYLITIKIETELFPQANFTINQDFLFVNQQIQFNFTGSKGNDPTKFFWDFGDGANSTITNPIHIYLFEGFYNVSLAVQDSDGDISVYLITIIIGIDLLPQANFTINQDFLFVNQQIQFNFTGSKGNEPTKFFWDFGDGNHSLKVDPSYFYTEIGVYQVTLILKDKNDQIDIISINISIQEDKKPQGIISFVQKDYFSEDQITFDFIGCFGNEPVKVLWNFGDGNISNELNPIHSYMMSGIFNVSIEILDGNGDFFSTYSIIDIRENRIPQAQFSISSEEIIAGQIIYFWFTGSIGNGNVTFFWDFGDGFNSSLENPSHIYQNPGVYSIYLSIMDINFDIDTCAKHNIIIVKEDFAPLVNIQLNTSRIIENSPILISANIFQGNLPFSYYWNISDGNISSNVSILYIFTSSGNYTITLLVIDSDGDKFQTQCSIIVEEDIFPKISCILNSSKIVLGQKINFTTKGVYGNEPFQFFWDFGDGFNSSKVTPVHLYQKVGNFSISLIVKDWDGDIQIIENMNIYVLSDLFPTAQFIINSTTAVEKQEIAFIFCGNEGNGHLQYYWNFGDGCKSNERNPIHFYETPGNYTVSLNVFDFDGDKDYFIFSNLSIVKDLFPFSSFFANTSKVKRQTYIKFIFDGLIGNQPGKLIWFVDSNVYSTNTSEITLYISNPNKFINISLKILDFNGDIDEYSKIYKVEFNYETIKEPISIFLGFGSALFGIYFLKKRKIIKFKPKRRRIKKIKI
ncbi:MAG: PKD domain-containing protein [Candidatus Lokiarchaeota archaeon]|nr:PKD domain-containing protein [Candidatus Harpocratesius repetitus]